MSGNQFINQTRILQPSERLKGIDVFVCVADVGSFAAAGQRLHLTASAISKAIARLEARLDVRLFNRTTRRLSLSDAGAAFYRTCTGVLAELEEAEHGLRAEGAAGAEPRGRVRVDLPASFGRLHALPVILAFVEHHPLLLPHVSFSDRFVDPVQDGIDIVVRIGGPDVWPAALGRRYLCAERLIFCASPAYLRRHGEPEDAAALERHHCVVYGRGDGRVNPWHFSGVQPGDEERRVLPGRLAVGDGEGQAMAVAAGHGIAQLPTWLVQRQLDDGTLVQVLPQLAMDGLPMNLVWLKSRQGLPKVNALVEVLGARLTPAGAGCS